MKITDWDKVRSCLQIQIDESVKADLVARYSEPHRAYHTMQHLSECLSWLHEIESLLTPRDFAVLFLALWFHDAVYDTRRSDNEEQSAELCRSTVQHAGASDALTSELVALILATKHNVDALSTTEQWLVDIDLAILAAPSSRFDEYEAQVRREYEWVPDSDFRTGRSRILRQFLDRPSLYGTDYFRSRLEATARANLLRSVARLES